MKTHNLSSKIIISLLIIVNFLFVRAQKSELTLRTNLDIDTLTFGSPYYKNSWSLDERVQFSIQEKEVLINYLRSYSSDSVNISIRKISEKQNSLNELRSKETTFFYKNKTYELGPHLYACFLKKKIEVVASKSVLDENGNQLFDEDGNPIYFDCLESIEIEDHLNSLKFIESWEYENLKFSKPNRLITFCEGDSLHNGMFNTEEFIHFHSINNSPDSIRFLEDISYDICFYKQWENVQDQKSILGYGINKNVSINALRSLHNYGVSQIEVYQFINALITDVNDGKLNIISNLSKEEKNHLFERITFVPKFNNLGDQQFDIQGAPVYEEAYVSYEFSDIAGIRFQEDWYLTSGRFGINKRVKAITFLVNDYGVNYKIIGYKALPFKIVFDK